jgi:hypothetical protein
MQSSFTRSLIVLFLIAIVCYCAIANRSGESFVSGTEGKLRTYDCHTAIDDPKFTTPQQKEFQVVLSEHSALDSNLQRRRPELRTQKCKIGDQCFSTTEYHNTQKLKNFQSSPDIISTRIGFEPKEPPVIKFVQHADNYVVPGNSASFEMQADLLDEHVLPELWFPRRFIGNKNNNPATHQYNTAIY